MTQLHAVCRNSLYDIGRLKVQGWNKIHHAKINQKTEELAILTTKKITREWLYILIERPIHHKDTVLLNAYVPNNRAGKHAKQKWKELKGETDKSMIIIGDCLSTTVRIRQKINNDIEKFNKNINKKSAN